MSAQAKSFVPCSTLDTIPLLYRVYTGSSWESMYIGLVIIIHLRIDLRVQVAMNF